MYTSKLTGIEISKHALTRYLERVSPVIRNLEKDLYKVLILHGGARNLVGNNTLTDGTITFVFDNRLLITTWRNP